MKRKVTDLKPNEAILISNDTERDAILQLFSEIALVLAKDELLSYPFYLRLNRAPVKIWTHKRLWLNTLIIPATYFIGSEGESVEADEHKPFDVEVYSEDKFVIYTTERDDMGEKVMCANIVTRSRLIEIVKKMESLLIKTLP